MSAVDLSNTRCVCCGSADLTQGHSRGAVGGILHADIVCGGCGATFDIIWGVPFLGGFETEDFIGLFEILTTAQSWNQAPSAEMPRRIWALCEGYHNAPDKEAFKAACEDDFVRAPWFTNRYHEWLESASLFGGVDMVGKAVLDVGAGMGFDTTILVGKGANVTTLEYSPQSVKHGLAMVPQARWIGGQSHILPFADDTFDYVTSNAALHHMRDIPATISEMLRVLKPGGMLFTTGDPFRPSDSSIDVEFEVFNQHAGVLTGINETIPRFGSLWETLEKYSAHLDIAFLVSLLSDEQPKGFSPVGGEGHNKGWVPAFPENIELLSRSSGTIAMSVRVREPLNPPAPFQSRFTLPAGLFASWFGDEGTAVRRLLPWMPPECVDRAFPGEQQSRIELLNGWMRPEPPFDARRAYKRARWFLTLPAGASRMGIEWRPTSPDGALMELLVNGEAVTTQRAAGDDEWSLAGLDLSSISPSVPFVIEMRISETGDGDDFDRSTFQVRQRAFS